MWIGEESMWFMAGVGHADDKSTCGDTGPITEVAADRE